MALVGKQYAPTFKLIFIIGSIVCGLIIWATW